VIRALLLGALLAGCASTRDQAVIAANAGHDIEDTLGDLLHGQCTEGYKMAQTTEAIFQLDRVCLPARKVYGAVRTARVALQAALTDTVPPGEAELTQRAAELAVATKQAVSVVRAMQELP
jgi:hypothetical protein